ncbi:hypothetical protein Actkin_01056 [Actinokineospora sp. UTMC 2448]|nr:hypothetical protein Actkin_01056 [Actinokineospora sp. UTMC 2448]
MTNESPESGERGSAEVDAATASEALEDYSGF